jgi:hypothetical protein
MAPGALLACGCCVPATRDASEELPEVLPLRFLSGIFHGEEATGMRPGQPMGVPVFTVLPLAHEFEVKVAESLREAVPGLFQA